MVTPFEGQGSHGAVERIRQGVVREVLSRTSELDTLTIRPAGPTGSRASAYWWGVRATEGQRGSHLAAPPKSGGALTFPSFDLLKQKIFAAVDKDGLGKTPIWRRAPNAKWSCRLRRRTAPSPASGCTRVVQDEPVPQETRLCPPNKLVQRRAET